MEEYDIDDLQKQRGGSQAYGGGLPMIPNEIIRAGGAQNSQDFDDFDSDEEFNNAQFAPQQTHGQIPIGLIQPPQLYKPMHFLQDSGPSGDIKDEYAQENNELDQFLLSEKLEMRQNQNPMLMLQQQQPSGMGHPYSHLLPGDIQSVLTTGRKALRRSLYSGDCLSRKRKCYTYRALPPQPTHYKTNDQNLMLLPFRTRRHEKNNNNGERKQVRYEVKRVKVNERVKQRQRQLREQKMLEIRRMIESGELTVDALKWKVRKDGFFPGLDNSIGGCSTQMGTIGTGSCMKAEELGEQANISINFEQAEHEMNLLLKRTLQLKKNGLPRLSSAKWSEEDASRFIRALRMHGKNWRKIAADVGTKNEQQCRTRGLILYNKLQRHKWDEQLYDILKPHQGINAVVKEEQEKRRRELKGDCKSKKRIRKTLKVGQKPKIAAFDENGKPIIPLKIDQENPEKMAEVAGPEAVFMFQNKTPQEIEDMRLKAARAKKLQKLFKVQTEKEMQEEEAKKLEIDRKNREERFQRRQSQTPIKSTPLMSRESAQTTSSTMEAFTNEIQQFVERVSTTTDNAPGPQNSQETAKKDEKPVKKIFETKKKPITSAQKKQTAIECMNPNTKVFKSQKVTHQTPPKSRVRNSLSDRGIYPLDLFPKREPGRAGSMEGKPPFQYSSSTEIINQNSYRGISPPLLMPKLLLSRPHKLSLHNNLRKQCLKKQIEPNQPLNNLKNQQSPLRQIPRNQ